MTLTAEQLVHIKSQIKAMAQTLGFQALGVSDIDLSIEEPRLQAWLDNNYHGEMDYMARHGMMRARPAELQPGTLRVISVRMDYLPEEAYFAQDLKEPNTAFISRYALGRDYHKLIRNRLKRLGQQISEKLEQELGFRPFVDSAPILERPLAAKAGLGWVGKHSLLLDEKAGSWFFLGELLVDLPLPVDEPVQEQCGSCVACMTMCPTQAIVAPYVVDGRRCISYLTIELQEAIPEEFRPLIGNRIYGCDDCQLVCPWNRYAELSCEQDFQKRGNVASQDLLTLWAWDEDTFLKNTEGSAIRRIGHQRWLRNIAVALGNAPYSAAIVSALTSKRVEVSELVVEHIDWALAQQAEKQKQQVNLDKKTQRLIRIVEKGLPRDA
ncbi:tRNA epoxyqueuosine(34) reductase QueG [Saccharobesus litoralis]|uniref:Epoxyqueuosine reductase n=1 Tax=Saccharobesus litoralis TaxID=2172099 RepID=A0A2S0VY53_9ALTE|nr:tRNA epoxyqueuosine(34) reductase QueG [Saccharobesus litoralis]AWB69102.1 tRNA epoxyqueuosine(34) reductase QueG [Saccharobesus litoralis]